MRQSREACLQEDKGRPMIVQGDCRELLKAMDAVQLTLEL